MIKIFFQYNNQLIQLPVNPEELTISTEGNNSTVEVVKLGEINILKLPKLSTLSIECFFPIDDSAPYVLTKGTNFKKPAELVKFFSDAYYASSPVWMIVTGIDSGIVKKPLLLSIENFPNTYKGGGDDDTYYTLNLKQFKNYGSKTYKTTFNVPKDDDGLVKVANVTKRNENLLARLKQEERRLENKVKVVTRTVTKAQKALNAFRSTGSVIHVGTSL